MVLKKRQYYGFNGFDISSIPRAPRSARGRAKRAEDSETCAFELLASLAGKLLQESETSSASSNASEANYQPSVGNDVIKHEHCEDRPFKRELNNRSYEKSAFISEFASPSKDEKCHLKEPVHGGTDSVLQRSSVVTNSDTSEKLIGDVKSVISKSKAACENSPIKVERGSPDFGEACGSHVENTFCRQHSADGLATGGLTNNSRAKDSVKLCTDFPVSINSDNNVKLPLRRDIPSILRHRNGVKLGIRDDDENFSRYNKSISKPKALRPPSRIGDRRIRKLLTSKYWKVAPKLKDCEHSRVVYLDGGMRYHYRKRKLCYGRDKYQLDSLYKRRKHSDHSLVATYDGGFSSESVCNSPEKGLGGDKNESAAIFHGANGISSSVGHQASFLTRNSHVKFSIKSFRIPELFVEVPETATVGSLKRTVMDAVTTILGGGLHVGVLLHGKKVRDDNRTLLQTGIASEENLDMLGFALEPNHVQAPTTVSTEDPPAQILSDTSKLVTMSPATPVFDSGVSDAIADPPPLNSSGNNIENDQEPTSSLTDIVTDRTTLDSRALVPVPPISAEVLSVVPLNQKSRRAEHVQRRTRRPFSVAEVEALVQAVEELGTGRWRDVKLRSFEDADHRTYVDLKDKWKTLVHTAGISPQQRRGEPVPQDLLDRVLAAHDYWTQHQAKQHSKNQAAVLKMSDGHSVRNGAAEGIGLL